MLKASIFTHAKLMTSKSQKNQIIALGFRNDLMEESSGVSCASSAVTFTYCITQQQCFLHRYAQGGGTDERTNTRCKHATEARRRKEPRSRHSP